MAGLDFGKHPDRYPLHMVISRDAIEAWAPHLDFGIQAIQRGGKPHIVLT